MNEPRSGGWCSRTAIEGRAATWVPVARDATMSWAADSFSYAERTVPRATPNWAARSCHDGKRAPDARTGLDRVPDAVTNLLRQRRLCSSIELQLQLGHEPVVYE